MNRSSAWLLAAALVSACGGGGGGSGNDGLTPGSAASGSLDARAVPAVAAPGAECAGVYGDPPRETEPSLSGTLASLYYVLPACALRGGEVLRWDDADGTARRACLFTPANATAATPMPLVTFLPGSVFPGDPQTLVAALDGQARRRGDLTGDPSRPGFNLLIVEGRDKKHFYPFPDHHALGFDHWYRNLNRNDPGINVDVATIDHFIGEVKARGIVDSRRVYMMGWSNGASMAILYALNTPGIAATAVYSSPNPFTDVGDPCAQEPFGNNLRPIMTVHNRCDIIGICSTGSQAFHRSLDDRIPQLEHRGVIIDALQGEVEACDARCDFSGAYADAFTAGALFHVRWPYAWTDEMLRFLRERPL
jgi:hypothetical protein